MKAASISHDFIVRLLLFLVLRGQISRARRQERRLGKW